MLVAICWDVWLRLLQRLHYRVSLSSYICTRVNLFNILMAAKHDFNVG